MRTMKVFGILFDKIIIDNFILTIPRLKFSSL